LSYRTLRMEFDLEEEQLDVLKEQLIDIEALAVDQDGKMLVWVGEGEKGATQKQSNGEVEKSPIPSTIDAPIEGLKEAPPERLSDTRRAEGERRQLTVIFCDLVGSTALSAQLDPEDYHTVVQRYHQTCETVTQRYGGFVPQHLGDGLLVYFGYPT